MTVSYGAQRPTCAAAPSIPLARSALLPKKRVQPQPASRRACCEGDVYGRARGGFEQTSLPCSTWCMCGQRPSVGSLADHSQLLESEIDGLSDRELPTLAELELFMPDGVEQTKPLRQVWRKRKSGQ